MTRSAQEVWAVGLGEGGEVAGAAVEAEFRVELVVGEGIDVVVVVIGPAQPAMRTTAITDAS